MKKKQKSRTARAANKVLFGVWLPRNEKEKLEWISEKTGIDQSKLARRAFEMLFDAYNRGQLELGFPDTRPQSGLSTQRAGL
jgi:hypothetical protein